MPAIVSSIGWSAPIVKSGAFTVGWSALWLNRNGASYPPSLPQPTATLTSLNDLPALFA